MPVFKNVRHWIHGLLSAIIGGGAGAVTATFSASLIDPQKFNLADPHGISNCLKMICLCFVVNGAIAMFAYLKQSPIPPEGDDTAFFNKPKEQNETEN